MIQRKFGRWAGCAADGRAKTARVITSNDKIRMIMIGRRFEQAKRYQSSGSLSSCAHRKAGKSAKLHTLFLNGLANARIAEAAQFRFTLVQVHRLKVGAARWMA